MHMHEDKNFHAEDKKYEIGMAVSLIYFSWGRIFKVMNQAWSTGIEHHHTSTLNLGCRSGIFGKKKQAEDLMLPSNEQCDFNLKKK